MELVEVAFFTDEVQKLKAFYEDLLGSEPVEASESTAVYLLGNTKIFIHETYAPGEGELPPEDHLAFGVRDLDGTCAALQGRGLELEIEPRTYYWGRSAYLRDPGGRLIELSEQVERS